MIFGKIVEAPEAQLLPSTEEQIANMHKLCGSSMWGCPTSVRFYADNIDKFLRAGSELHVEGVRYVYVGHGVIRSVRGSDLLLRRITPERLSPSNNPGKASHSMNLRRIEICSSEDPARRLFITPTDMKHSQNYPLGCAALSTTRNIAEFAEGIRFDMSRGNHLLEYQMRPSTQEEVDAFLYANHLWRAE